MRPMAFAAPSILAARLKIVLEYKRSGGLRMARYAHLLAGPDLLGGIFIRVRLVTVAANHPALRNRMVEVMPKLTNFFSMALSAH